MIRIKLIEVEPQLMLHKTFLYEIIKFRWENHELINISHRTKNVVPTFSQHEQALCSSTYKHHYIICLGDVYIGSTYVDKNDIYGMFILPKYLKQALKEYGKKNTELATRPEPISVIVFKNLIALHPEITTFYAAVNPKNTLSRNAMIRAGHEEIEVILRQKTVNGKLPGGEWPDINEESI